MAHFFLACDSLELQAPIRGPIKIDCFFIAWNINGTVSWYTFSMVDIIGSIMMLLWVAYVTIGLGSQIYKNKKDNNFGWSIPLLFLPL